MGPAVHENDRPRDLHGCEWHEALNAHAMNPVLRLIHANLPVLREILEQCTLSKAPSLVLEIAQGVVVRVIHR
jgi:hypothetical protein